MHVGYACRQGQIRRQGRTVDDVIDLRELLNGSLGWVFTHPFFDLAEREQAFYTLVSLYRQASLSAIRSLGFMLGRTEKGGIL